MAGRNTTPVRGSGGIRHFGGDGWNCTRTILPWAVSATCSSRNSAVPASVSTDSYGLPGSSQGDTEPSKSPPTPGTVTPCTEPSAAKVLFDQPNQAWVSDITYIPTAEGWLYLSIVKNLCTRKMVGYAFSERIDTSLTLEALHLAVRRCKPPKGLIFHSDRGVQYASGAFRECLKSYGIRQSMSRKGDPCDNAVAENFFSCLKCELIHLKQYPTRASAQADVFAYLEAFYNTVRPHSALGWLSPAQFEANLLPSCAA